MIGRRALLATGAAALAAPPLAAPSVAAGAKTVRFVPNTDVAVLDPVANTASQVRTHGFLLFDTLFGLDQSYAPQLQMLEGALAEDGGRRWTLTLRPGLVFHDGTPVLARDCVASIRRWAAVDGFGAMLLASTDALEAPRDDTLVFRLRTPFPLLPSALGKISPNFCAIMPARLAETSPRTPLAEIVGSGPFRLVADERVPGARTVYARFDRYSPRSEAPGLTSGAKRVNVDRVEWLVLPDPATASAAIQRGDVDWLESPAPDLLPPLRRDPNLVVRVNDPTGVLPILRFNCLHPPFDNAAIRRAVLSATQQSEFMQAFTDDASNTRTGVGIFCPGSPMATPAGLAELVGTASLDAARAAIAAAGYKGERALLMDPTDHPVNSVMAQVALDLLKKLGLAVDDVAMDAAGMFQRRVNRDDPAHGGWSAFPAAIAGEGLLDPAVSFLARADGDKAWYGWPADPALEEIRAAWFAAPGLPAQQALAERMQVQTFRTAPYLPLGQILQPAVMRTSLTGLLPGFAKFWALDKA